MKLWLLASLGLGLFSAADALRLQTDATAAAESMMKEMESQEETLNQHVLQLAALIEKIEETVEHAIGSGANPFASMNEKANATAAASGTVSVAAVADSSEKKVVEGAEAKKAADSTHAEHVAAKKKVVAAAKKAAPAAAAVPKAAAPVMAAAKAKTYDAVVPARAEGVAGTESKKTEALPASLDAEDKKVQAKEAKAKAYTEEELAKVTKELNDKKKQHKKAHPTHFEFPPELQKLEASMKKPIHDPMQDKLTGLTLMIPMLEDMYGKFKADIVSNNKLEKQSTKRLEQYQKDYDTIVNDKTGKNKYLLSEKERALKYFKKQRSIQHRHYHAMLKMAHASMERLNKVKKMVENAKNGKKLSQGDMESLQAMVPSGTV